MVSGNKKMSRLSKNCQKLWKNVKNCQNCKNFQKLSKTFKIFNIVKNCQNCQNVSQVMFLINVIKCLKGHWSLGSLFNVKKQKVSEWVSESVSEWVSDKVTYWAVRWQLKKVRENKNIKTNFIAAAGVPTNGTSKWVCFDIWCCICISNIIIISISNCPTFITPTFITSNIHHPLLKIRYSSSWTFIT